MYDRKSPFKAFSPRWIAYVSALAALSVIISWIERPVAALLPLPVPGFRLGFSNIALISAIYCLGPVPAAAVLFLRTGISALLFGSPVSYALSVSGGAFACCAMLCLYRSPHFSEIGVSMAGAAAHMTGQIAAASLILSAPALFLAYLPWLLLLSVPAGALTGALSAMLNRGLSGFLKNPRR